jgi:YidC/Oxa1 family membrane protein insertase
VPQPNVTPGATSVPTQGATPPGSAPAAGSVPAASSGAAPATNVTVKTDLVTAVISSDGGDLRYLALTQHKDSEDKNKDFVLLGTHNYYAQTGLLAPGANLPTHVTPFTVVPGPTELKAGENELKVRLEASAGAVKVAKIYTFHRGSYAIDLNYEVTNGGTAPINTSAYLQLLRDDKSPPGETKFMHTYTGPAFYTADKHFQKFDFSDINKKKDLPVEPATNGWVAMVQHYFTTAWLPQGDAKREFYAKKLADDLYSVGVFMPVGIIAPGATGSLSAKLYAGPEEVESMAKLAPGLELVKDYGVLKIIAQPMYELLKFLHGYLGNWGLSIIALTVIIKGIFFPLSAASYKSMARMKKVTPKMTAIREKYASDRMKMNQAMMELYKTEKINPLGGCLPMIIQIPVFISLYWALLATVEMRHAPFYLWITDLSAPDTLFGTLPGVNMPIGLLPIIMAVSMFLQTKMNPAPPDPVQAKMMTIMPIVFSVFFFFFPAGLVLYWVVNNILSIAQQYTITRVLDKEGKADRKAANDASAKGKK